MAHSELYSRNLAIFAEHFPQIHALLVAENPISFPVFDGELPVDIDLGTGRLYKQDAREFSQKQVADYLSTPRRISYNVPTQPNFDSLITRRVYSTLLASITEHANGDILNTPVTRTGFLVVLGVGLGYHLPQLLAQLDVPHVILCEPIDEFIRASLDAIDWAELLDLCARKNTTLHLICKSNPTGLMAGITAIFNEVGSVLIDGSYLYQHYPLWTLEETKRRFINELPRQMVGLGYFEDERKMFCNTATNLHRNDHYIFNAKFRQRGNTPVFIVGAGPSLDDDLDVIAEWREHAIVFSCGSGLQPLLKRGIIPDFHTEIENSPVIYDKIKHIMEANSEMFPEGKFTGVTLIASSTLNPRVSKYFEDTFFLFRDSVCSTTSLGRDFLPMYGVAPTVANTSVTTAAYLGFGDMYLFGLDCGWREGTRHHAKETIWYTAETFKTESMKGSYSIPGNFGGIFQTDMVFDWCRNMLEQALRAYKITAFNCSDGVLIDGSTPKVSEAIHLNNPPLDRPEILKKIREDLKFFKKGEFFKDTDTSYLLEQVDSFEGEIMPLLHDALEQDWNFHEFYGHLSKVLQKPEFGKDRGITGLFSFTTMNEMKLAAVLINRIHDGTARQTITRDFYRLYQTIHEEMFAEGRTIIKETQAMFLGQLDPAWTQGLLTTPGTSY